MQHIFCIKRWSAKVKYHHNVLLLPMIQYDTDYGAFIMVLLQNGSTLKNKSIFSFFVDYNEQPLLLSTNILAA